MRLIGLLWGLAGCAGPAEHGEDHATPVAVATPGAAQPLQPSPGRLRYRVSFGQPHTQLFSVEAVAATDGADELVWMMATWTPGSYLVREYARHVEGVTAAGAGGEPLAVRRTSKNRWAVATNGSETVTLRYQLYANELSVRTNHVDVDHAILNGAPTFLVPIHHKDRPAEVELVLPEGWTDTVTGLQPHPSGRPHTYLAESYDELIDSPIVAGSPVRHAFELQGVPHELVNLGGDGVWDQDRSLEGARAVLQAHIDFWGVVPYEHYHLINGIVGSRGGLEHLDSTLIFTRRDATSDDERFESWLGLVSHEFFHAWNVKRLRPAGLGPFDYETETMTPSLWIAEGVTSYYDDLLLVRADLLEGERHLELLSKSIKGLQTRPGRAVQSLASSSRDAWIKHYRPDENSVNSAVSYYRKGSLVALLLDAEIRRRTGDRRSLDDVLRLAWERHAESGYTEAEFRQVASDVAGSDLSGWLHAAVDTTAELDYAPMLSWWGLLLGEAEPDGESEAWLGLSAPGGRVDKVRRDTPVWRGGLNVGDEVLGVAGFRYDAEQLERVLESLQVGEEVELLVSRRGVLRTLPIVIGAAPTDSWELKLDPRATTAQKLRRERWWGKR